ncbi:SAG family member [Eimeria brunetti]|uniref:SAG family member n=1 Tax=Eimeria brunetti TaxID=51314 RepID=U6LCX8_9EIME|nr:SAG family member [Eimeria brunetti]
MASLYRAIAGVCLVAFSGLQSEAAGGKTYKWTAEKVTDDAYLSVKLARNGKLPVHINDVAVDEKLVTSLTEIVEGEEEVDEPNCRKLMEAKAEIKDVFYHVVESEGEPNYRQLLQASLNEGLEAFTNKEYPKSANEWQQIWAKDTGANLAYLLSSNSTTVGCVLGKCTSVQTSPPGPAGRNSETTVEMTLLICDLDPPATKGQAPFDEDYFTGLIARTAQLEDMTTDDLKTTNDGTSAAAVPAFVLSGLVAMLTAVSA